MFERIDRKGAKAESRAILRDAQVSPKAFFALYLGAMLLIDLCGYLSSMAGSGSGLLPVSGPAELFISIFSTLLSPILTAGIYLYCLAIRRGERAEFLTLFDGFSFAGKVILLYLLQMLYICLWSMLFVIPGIIAAYRYRFAYLNLCENPGLTASEALKLSTKQTTGYKSQLFMLDLSFYGWILLASLPALLLSSMVWDTELYNSIVANPLYLLAETACFFLFSLLYLPVFHTTEVAYYETAVRTSGADPNRFRHEDDADPFF